MASRSARRRKNAARRLVAQPGQSMLPAVPAAAAEPTLASPVPVLPLAVSYRDPDEPPAFAQLLDVYSGLPDPPGTIWAQPVDLSRRGLARAFLQLWPQARSAVMAAADEPTLSDDPQPDPYDWTLAFEPAEVAHV